jgi:hypothetical protein
VPRRPILKQLPRALKIDIDVLYLWGRVLPSDIRVEGLSEDARTRGSVGVVAWLVQPHPHGRASVEKRPVNVYHARCYMWTIPQ